MWLLCLCLLWLWLCLLWLLLLLCNGFPFALLTGPWLVGGSKGFGGVMIDTGVVVFFLGLVFWWLLFVLLRTNFHFVGVLDWVILD
jgi:hypothetical protein